MLGSITPLGERGHSRRWSATVVWYFVGSVLGGAVIGGLLGAVGAEVRALGLELSGTAVLAVVGVLSLAGVAFDLRLGGLRLPSISRQVNEDWLVRYRSWVVGVGFGFQLGLGVVTIVTTATLYVALATALLAGSLPAGLALGVVLGLARALPLLAARNVDSAPRLRTQHLRLVAWAPRVHTVAVAALIVAAVVAIGIVSLGSLGVVAA
jgi:hypothetical protein